MFETIIIVVIILSFLLIILFQSNIIGDYVRISKEMMRQIDRQQKLLDEYQELAEAMLKKIQSREEGGKYEEK